MLERSHASFLQLGCNEFEKNNFSNIVAIKISVVLEFNITNISSADTNLDTFRYQKSSLK